MTELEKRVALVEDMVQKWSDAGKAILKEIKGLQEDLRHASEVPPLMGTKEASEALGLLPSNLIRKKGMPKPVTYITGRPLWLERDILAFKDQLEGRNYL